MNKRLLSEGKIDFIPISIVFLGSILKLFLPQLNSFVLAVALPVLALWCLLKDYNILKNHFVRLYIALIIWILVTLITSVDINYSIKVLKPILGGLVTSIIMYSLSRNNGRNAYWLFMSYIISFVASLYFLYNSGELLSIDVSKTRLDVDDSGLNANDLAYYLFYITIVVTIIFWDVTDKIKIRVYLLYIILVITTLFVSIITASRQVLAIVLPFVAFSYLFRFVTRISVKKILFYIIPSAIFALFVYYYYMANYYEGSFLELRMGIDMEDESRVSLMKKGLEIGMNNPIFGVGIGNMANLTKGGFSHISYVELFATTGLIGAIIFIMMVVNSIRLNFKRYKKSNNRIFLYLVWAFIAWAIYNFFFVFYISPWLMSFFFLLVGYSEYIYKRAFLIRKKIQ